MEPVSSDPRPPISRRTFLGTGVAAALGAGALEAQAKAPDFSFVVVTDLHYRDRRCGPWAERVAAHIHAMRPRPAFVVLAGDLSDEGTAAQLGPVREIFRPLPMPVHTLLGNHDVKPDGGRADYERIFGARHNLHFGQGGHQFLLLNSTESRSVFRTYIPAETLEYAEHAAADLPANEPLVVVTHYPLGTNWLRPRNADALLYKLRKHALVAAYSGHWHGWSDQVDGRARLLTGRCCSWWRENHDGSNLKGYTVCHARAGRVTQEFVAVPTRGIA
jgi:predicted phosphodiesterase